MHMTDVIIMYLSVASIIETPTSLESSSAVSEECSFTYMCSRMYDIVSIRVWREGEGGE